MTTITLPVSILDRVEDRLKEALEEVRALKRSKTKKSVKKIRFWTKKKWEIVEKEADEDIKAGRVYRLNSIEDLDKPLSKLVISR